MFIPCTALVVWETLQTFMESAPRPSAFLGLAPPLPCVPGVGGGEERTKGTALHWGCSDQTWAEMKVLVVSLDPHRSPVESAPLGGVASFGQHSRITGTFFESTAVLTFTSKN